MQTPALRQASYSRRVLGQANSSDEQIPLMIQDSSDVQIPLMTTFSSDVQIPLMGENSCDGKIPQVRKDSQKGVAEQSALREPPVRSDFGCESDDSECDLLQLQLEHANIGPKAR